MAKLRHVALYADDIEATASFYEKAFDMQRVLQREHAITLSDGVVSMAIVNAARRSNGKPGLDHIGFSSTIWTQQPPGTRSGSRVNSASPGSRQRPWSP